jgi:hypothetical protein
VAKKKGPSKTFQTGLILIGKAGAYLSGAQALLSKLSTWQVTNVLAYFPRKEKKFYNVLTMKPSRSFFIGSRVMEYLTMLLERANRWFVADSAKFYKRLMYLPFCNFLF